MTIHRAKHAGLILGVMLLLPLVVTASDRLVQVGGLDLWMEPPAGFTTATAFTGFQDVQSFSTIEVREVEAPIDAIAGQLTGEALSGKGMDLVSEESLQIDGRRALLLQVAPRPSTPPFNKWLLVIGDQYRSVSITAAYPQQAGPEVAESLKQALLSSRWLRTAEQQLFYDLPFTVTQTEDLKYTRRTPKMLVLADASATGSLTPEAPSIVVGHVDSPTELVDIKAVSHAHLEQLKSLEIVSVLTGKETKVAGIRAYRIEAAARIKATDTPVRFEQILVFQPYKYLLIQSSVETAQAERYVPQFNEVVESVQFKKPR